MRSFLWGRPPLHRRAFLPPGPAKLWYGLAAPMQKYTALLFGLVVVAAVALIISQRPGKGGAPAPSAVTEALRDAGPPADAGARADAAATAETTPAPPAPPPEDGPAQPDSPFVDRDAGTTLLSGTAPPSLAGDAPKSVVFGVILVQYKGAQLAPPSSRSREAALELARQIAADAQTDFKAALATYGDKGLSLENAGRMPRGMLEPAPEYVLFSLPKDGVSEPVDTPRGFWIVHRIE